MYTIYKQLVFGRIFVQYRYFDCGPSGRGAEIYGFR